MTDISEKSSVPEDILAHYGVKGMRWGVRKERPSGRAARGEAINKKRVEAGKAPLPMKADRRAKLDALRNKKESQPKKALSPKTKKTMAVVASVGGAALISAGSLAVGKQLGARGKYTMQEMNLYAARHAGRVGSEFIKDNIDFEVAMAHVRNVERGYRNNLGGR